METSPQKTSPKNQSSAKAFEIVELLASKNNEPQRLQDIAAALSMNSSTVLRFLITMNEFGYITQDPQTLRYSLTLKICYLANKVSSNIHLFDLAQPIMRRVAAECNESVCLAIEQNLTVVYIGVAYGPDQMVRSMQRIGNQAPMHCTGIGKLLLLNYSNTEIHGIIETKGLPRFTDKTIVSETGLLEELKTVRERGVAYDNEECEVGASCIAVPIRNYTGKIIAGMSVTGPIFRMSEKDLEHKLPVLLRCSEELSAMLGYRKDD